MMKCLLAAILAALLLAGCAAEDPSDTTVSTTATTTASYLETAPGIYDPEDALEQLTGGAVLAFQTQENCTGLRMLGEDILLFYGMEGQTHLVLHTGENLAEKARITLECDIDPESAMVQTNTTGIAYCCMEENQLIQMDSQLREVTRIDLPADMIGEPVLSPDLNYLYYCTEQEIRALDLRGGYSRLLKSQQVQSHTLLQCGMDGSVLLCDICDTDGEYYTAFISTENGETLGRTTGLYSFASPGDSYLLQRSEGSICQVIFGESDGEPKVLTVGNGTQRVIFAPGMRTALTAEKEADGIYLDAYDLTSGRKAASVMLQDQQQLLAAVGIGDSIWLLTDQKLCRWDMTQSAVEETEVYTGTYFNAQSPDILSLGDCVTEAKLLGEKYAVDIRVWTDAATDTGSYSIEEEYQPVAIKNGLRALEGAMERYPEGLLAGLGQNTADGEIHISLVRSIEGGFTGGQFWENGKAYIILAIGEDTQSAFHRELSHVLDTYIFGRSREYDDWDAVNPDEFTYDYSYDVYTGREDTRWLTDEDRAFINSFSMTYPNEDRATVLEYAIGFGNEAYFQTEVMQTKLQKVCDAIREAFEWEDLEEAFLWEQYLIIAEE